MSTAAEHRPPVDGDTVRRRVVVLVNGLPGAGKSTLAAALAGALELPLFSKDHLKETLADVLGTAPPYGIAPRQWSAMLGAAAGESLWTLLAHAGRGAVLESPWLSDLRPVVAAGLERAGVDHVHEVWCDVPVRLARERYEGRVRHAIHLDERVDDEIWQKWVARAEPLGIGTLHRVDTSKAVDLIALLDAFN
ncbi:AAA family ATPase [Nonomuraea sp. NPDC050556]|uniref:AAA family ATPase n=1 Tax=Nonomuraea sp. NPDC050556 TaxID=3364369 RepID=UPI0037BA9CD3